MNTSITRTGNLGRVFGWGQSDTLNIIARLCVLYEDLRLELGEMKLIEERGPDVGELDRDFRLAYFLRRGLLTLEEFGRGLSAVRATAEFKAAKGSFTELDADPHTGS